MESKYLVIAGVLSWRACFWFKVLRLGSDIHPMNRQVLATRIMQDSLAVIRQARLELEIP